MRTGLLARCMALATLRLPAEVRLPHIFSGHFSNVLRCALLLLLPSMALAQVGPPVATPLKTLRTSHPRLVLLDSDLPGIKSRIAADPFAKANYNSLLAEAQSLLSTQPKVFLLNGPNKTLLWTAREMERRILTLSGIYRLTGDRRFADRASAEMLAAAAFPNWDPRHFLVTAEMTTTLGIGYDWLYPVLSADQRETIKQALIEKGINPFIRLMARNGFHLRNNWAQVIYGGETVGALAILEPGDATVSKLAETVIGYSRPGIADVMDLFAPDGGFEEGPVYWNYATIYNVLYIASLDSALGTDFGAADATGFDRTPRYEIQANGPFYMYANFGDADAEAYSASPQMYWFANRFHQPVYAQHERDLEVHLGKKIQAMIPYRGLSRFEMMGLLWYAAGPAPENAPPLPLVESFSRVAQAFMRTAWSDPDAWYVGFKGGDARASHAHLDLGSFVLDALGKRWAADLGPDTYGLPGYFGKQRWSYFRTQTRAHNTLTVDESNEDLDSTSDLLFAGRKGKDELAVADLDKAYKGRLQTWRRGVAILDSRRVLVQDEVSPAKPVDLVWHLHTPAKVSIKADGRSATLELEGATMQAKIIAPAEAHFTTATVSITPAETPNPGITNLTIKLPRASTQQVIAVLFSSGHDNKSVHLRSLKDWKDKAHSH